MTAAALLLAAMVIWAVGAALDLMVGARTRWARTVALLAALIGCGFVTAAGVRMDLGARSMVHLGSTLGVGQTTLSLDPLAGLFLTLIGGLGLAVSACLASWAQPENRLRGRGMQAAYLLLLGAVVVIVIAGDAFTFLFGWETLTVAFYVLIGSPPRHRAGARASWVTLGIGKLSGAALLFGFLLLAGQVHSYTFSTWAGAPSGAVRDAAFALVVVGFGAKAGLVPFQVWLPIGYPAAPGPVRAAMAGVAVNVGFYGLWRFLGILGRPPVWLAATVLIVGGITALVGIVFAAVQSGLNRVMAYSSVENAGVILVGYGVALAGAATRQAGVVAIGLVAASLQVLAHAVAKSSLFSSSSFFESDFGSDQLESLRGVGRRDRWSATVFGLGSVTLAGLPPTIGFVSEWFILEALLQEFRVHNLALRLSMALAGALVALTVGVALLCFIRLVGLVLLGRSGRDGVAARAIDGGALGRTGLGVMGSSCLALAAAAPWVVRFIADGLAPVVPHATTLGALKEPWVLQPVFSDFSILSPSWLFVVLPMGLTIVGVATVALSRGTVLRVRRVPAWHSATAGVAGPDSYSPFGYANVLRHVLANVLGSQRSAVRADGPGSSPQSAADSDHAHISVRTDVVEPVESYIYRPAWATWLGLARCAKRLQSGRLDAYVAYMLAALLILLAVVASMK
jgi:hydrogenase-4 component B